MFSCNKAKFCIGSACLLPLELVGRDDTDTGTGLIDWSADIGTETRGYSKTTILTSPLE